MNKKNVGTYWLAITIIIFFSTSAFAEEAGRIQLPPPQTEGGKPLFEALKERTSTRQYGPDKISLPIISNLLWAAFGINRQDSGKRTAPSAHNWQEIDIYAATEDGLYRYDEKGHALELVLSQDIRAQTGAQKFVKDAPLNLIFVADLSRMGKASTEEKLFYTAADAGFVSQNIYLYCASEGLATVVRRWIDRPALAKAMNLRPDQEVILAQTVGYGKK